MLFRAVVVAQLVERLCQLPEIRGSNPVTGKNLYWTFTVNCFEKTKLKKKEAGNGPFLENIITDLINLYFEGRNVNRNILFWKSKFTFW